MTIAGRRKPKRYAEETQAQAQRFHCLERDEGRCRFEIAVELTPGSTHFVGERVIEWDGDVAWTRCGSTRNLQTAHIVRRWKCGNILTDDNIPIKFHPCVAIIGCYNCHTKYDSRLHRATVRMPRDAAAMARALIEHTLLAARARGEVAIDVDLTDI